VAVQFTGVCNRLCAYRDKEVGVFVRFRAPLHQQFIDLKTECKKFKKIINQNTIISNPANIGLCNPKIRP
jgi:hypothetical protein